MQRGFSLIIVLIGLVVLTGLIYGGYAYFQQQKIKQIDSFEECAKEYPVMESYPAQCNTPDGRHFVQELSDEEKQKLVPPIDTSNWTNYTNQKYGYSIKFPDDWSISTAPGVEDIARATGLSFENNCVYENSDLCIRIDIGSLPVKDRGNLDPFFNIQIDTSKPDIVLSRKVTTLGREKAQEWVIHQTNYGTGLDTDPGRLLYVLVSSHNGNKYQITYEEQKKDKIITRPNDWEEKRVLDTMISTFKFLE